MSQWKRTTSNKDGVHWVIKPGDGLLRYGSFLRINIGTGKTQAISTGSMEMVFCVIAGPCKIEVNDKAFDCKKLDSVYAPFNSEVTIQAFDEPVILYVPAAQSDKEIAPYKTVFDMSIPIGDRKQVHGEGVGRRDVFMTIAPQDPACRIIAGYTWGQEGMWTSWPPHQHEEHLEEVYVYFDMPKDQFGLNLVFNEDLSDFYAHKVESGDLIAMPNGYHPTVATPGVKNTYLWALFAHDPAKDRRYDLAQMHPNIG
jgi:5-deoxy-glucuronate isomerase